MTHEEIKAAAKEGAREVLKELGIFTEDDHDREHARNVWAWAQRQQKMQAKVGDTIRTATVWTLVASGLVALGYGIVHMVYTADDTVHAVGKHAAESILSLKFTRSA